MLKRLKGTALAAGLVAGLGAAAQPALADVELTFFYPIAVGGPITKIVDGYAKAYSEQTPGVTITPVYTGSYQDTIAKTLTATRGGTPPDIAVILAVDSFTLYDEDLIVPVADLAQSDEAKAWLDSFYPAFLENGRIEGKAWGVPFQRSTPVLYWNKETFKEAGLDPEVPPASWEEQVEFARKLTKKDASGNVTQYGVQIPSSGFPYWLFQGLAIENGVQLMNEDGNEVYFDDPKVVEALQYMVDLSKEHGVMAPGIIEWGTTPKDFFEGRTAMMWTTTGNLTNVRTNAPFEFGVAMLPAKERRGAPTGGGNIFIFKGIGEEKQKAALDFVKWLTKPELQADWSIATGYVATSPAGWQTEAMKAYVADFPAAAVARDQLEHAMAELSTHENQRVTKVFNDALQAALTGAKEPKAALEEAQAEAMRILAPYR
ncbi:ABC transporter substrate-binding protein [Geminicoccaceae bacterium 1502E]|nr:ABC transporter substrate-binding protein [Geminicoccaceae bacterium 1502E]